MKKILLLIIGCFLMVGCSIKNKSAIGTEEFGSIMEEEGFTSVDNISEYTNDEYIMAANVATLDDITIEMVIYTDEDSANKVQEDHISKFKLLKSISASQKSTKGNNYYKYVYIASGYYMISSRIDNTLIFSKTSIDNLDKMEEVFEKLGY